LPGLLPSLLSSSPLKRTGEEARGQGKRIEDRGRGQGRTGGQRQRRRGEDRGQERGAEGRPPLLPALAPTCGRSRAALRAGGGGCFARRGENKYPFYTKKAADFILFNRVVEIMNDKGHLTLEGLHRIVNLRASLNLGLSNLQKASFPNYNPVERPIIKTTEIADLNWIAGFASGEGCFLVSIYNSKTTIGQAVKLIFSISQHERDKNLASPLLLSPLSSLLSPLSSLLSPISSAYGHLSSPVLYPLPLSSSLFPCPL
jgi:LAGLIDADG endonuclease